MTMMKRWILILSATAFGLFILGTSAIGWVLFCWIPVGGKAYIIQELERQGQLDMSIASMRYQPFQGIDLQDVLVVDRKTQQTWLQASQMQAHLSWWRWLSKPDTIGFDLSGALEAPCRTEVTLAGAYHRPTRTFTLEVRSDDFALSSLSDLLRAKIPSSLTHGRMRLALHATKEPGQVPKLSGQLIAQELEWKTATARAKGKITVDGNLILSSKEQEPWKTDATAWLDDGTVEGIEPVGTIRHLTGRARLSGDQLEIENLTGQALDSLWTATGIVHLAHPASAEVYVRSDLMLASLLNLFPALKTTYQAEGTAQIRAVCRSALQAGVGLDCMAKADVPNATLSVSTLPEPITEISGHVDYDHLTRRLTTSGLEAKFQGHPLSTKGQITGGQTLSVSLNVKGTLPLAAIQGWAQSQQKVTHLDGLALLDIKIDGPMRQLHYTGQMELQKVTGQIVGFAHPIEDVSGAVLLTENAIQLQQVSLRVAQQSLTLTASLTRSQAPQVTANLQWPQGHLDWDSRITPDTIVINKAEMIVGQSRLRIEGTLSRNTKQSHALNLEGNVDLTKLEGVPFLKLPDWKGWAPQGNLHFEATVRDLHSEWKEATIRARIGAERLRLREIPLERLTADIEQRDGILNLDIHNASLAQGTLKAGLTLKHRAAATEYLIQVDVGSAQLESIAAAIPAWANRSVRGIASLHALVSGTWEQRATWHGEGWFNASGDHLGDIPLLDRLFQRAVFGPLAEWLGLEPLRRATITQTALHWKLENEQITTDDLRVAGLVGTGAIVVYAKGRVGLDQSIAFEIEPELSEQIIVQSRAISGIAHLLKTGSVMNRLPKLFRYRLTGTIKDPKPQFRLSPMALLKEWF